MRKTTASLGLAVPPLGGLPTLAFPRLTDTSFDYFLMPLLGYLALLGAAKLLALMRRQRSADKA